MERLPGLGESATEVVWWAAWWKVAGVPRVPATDVAIASCVAVMSAKYCVFGPLDLH